MEEGGNNEADGEGASGGGSEGRYPRIPPPPACFRTPGTSAKIHEGRGTRDRRDKSGCEAAKGYPRDGGMGGWDGRVDGGPGGTDGRAEGRWREKVRGSVVRAALAVDETRGLSKMGASEDDGA
jgi:hypothetical protein